jgi:electron transfer flavoprotein beta subunit
MNILVCMKQVLDPDVPARDFRIDAANKQAERGGANLVPNIFCENALETALQLRDATESKVTALSFGTEESEDVVRKALAMTVDEAHSILETGHPARQKLAMAIEAHVLAAAARKLGEFDLVMVGRESGDWGVGQTGGLLAEELGLPLVALVDQATAEGEGISLRRQTDYGSDTVETGGPVLATITNCEGNVPRIPKTRDVMKSYRKPLTTWSVDELGVDTAETVAEVVELSIPEKDVVCEFVEGDSVEEKVDAFAQRIADVMSGLG